MRAAIELIDDLEDRVLQLLAGCFRCEQLPYHKVHHIIGITLGVNAIQVPTPSPFAMIEGDQTLFGKRRNKLNDEKWIAGSLLVDQLRQPGGALRFAMKRVHN